jgi:demethylmenaquinone methyltransferase / 2-methoxy-6-polyprenyl-1,4-benzoquinol methylase
MANKFYSPGAQQAGRVRDLFATVAARYDLVNDLQSFGLHRLWKRQLIRQARPAPADQALDLCCGTGDVTFALERAGCVVVGLDFSAPMLEVARARRQRGGLRASLLRGDALVLPFADDQFDMVTISYGLRNVADFEGALREMVRVLRPGGRLLVLDFGKPPNPLWRAVYFAYLRFAVPVLGRIFCGDSQTHAYILESLRNYPAQEGVARAMHALNCTNVGVTNLLGGMMSINYGEKANRRAKSTA